MTKFILFNKLKVFPFLTIEDAEAFLKLIKFENREFLIAKLNQNCLDGYDPKFPFNDLFIIVENNDNSKKFFYDMDGRTTHTFTEPFFKKLVSQ